MSKIGNNPVEQNEVALYSVEQNSEVRKANLLEGKTDKISPEIVLNTVQPIPVEVIDSMKKDLTEACENLSESEIREEIAKFDERVTRGDISIEQLLEEVLTLYTNLMHKSQRFNHDYTLRKTQEIRTLAKKIKKSFNSKLKFALQITFACLTIAGGFAGGYGAVAPHLTKAANVLKIGTVSLIGTKTSGAVAQAAGTVLEGAGKATQAGAGMAGDKEQAIRTLLEAMQHEQKRLQQNVDDAERQNVQKREQAQRKNEDTEAAAHRAKSQLLNPNAG